MSNQMQDTNRLNKMLRIRKFNENYVMKLCIESFKTVMKKKSLFLKKLFSLIKSLNMHGVWNMSQHDLNPVEK